MKMSFIKTQLLPAKASKQTLWLLNILNRKIYGLFSYLQGPHQSRHPSAWDDLTAPFKKKPIGIGLLYSCINSSFRGERQFAHRYNCLMLATLLVFALEKSIDTFWNFSPITFSILLRFIFLFPYYTAFPTVFMWIPNVSIKNKSVFRFHFTKKPHGRWACYVYHIFTPHGLQKSFHKLAGSFFIATTPSKLF